MGCAPVRRGLGRTEVVIILVVIASVLVVGCFGTALLGGLLLPALAKAQRNARSMKDSAQLQQIHTASVAFAREFGGAFLTPSLLAAGEEGSEDLSLNHSANLYSMMIMQNYFAPDLLISPVEVAAHVTPIVYDYNDYDGYLPVNDVHWDDSFVMHIHDSAVGANASYVHLTLVGDRRRLHWRDTLEPAMPAFGNRGVKGGLGPGNPEYDRSPTLRFHGSSKQWVGNICFNDNHVELLNTFTPPGLTYDDGSGPRPDNIFAADFSHPDGNQAAADAFLSIYISATEFTVEDVYDPLE